MATADLIMPLGNWFEFCLRLRDTLLGANSLSHPSGGLRGPQGSELVEKASLYVNEARGCGGWIVCQILGRYNLTLTA